MKTTLALCAALWVAALGPAPASADTYVVNSTDDAVDVAIGNGACATAAGTCTLRAAIQEANAHAGADVVTVAAGLYLLGLSGAGEDGGATGDLDVTDALEIDGAGAGSTIVDGLAADRILHSTATALTVRDLTMRHGVVAPAPGGALYQAVAGSVTLERVDVGGNSASTGGAIAQADGALVVSDSTLEANSAASGGAIAHGGTGALTVTNTVFTSNVATSGNAGALGTSTSGPVAITDCTFSSNGATLGGGGVYAVGASAFSVTRCTITDNDALPNGFGGGLVYLGPGTATVTDTKVLANRAFESGGMTLSGSGTAQISNSEFSDNVGLSSSGAGLYASASMGVTIQNVAARRNLNLVGPGGGIVAVGAAVAVTDVEVSDNAALGAGGLAASGTTVTLTRVRALRNSASNGSGGGIVISGTTAAVSDSTIDGNVGRNLGGGLFASATSLDLTGSTASNNRLISGTGGGLAIFVTAPSSLTNVTISGNVSDSGGGGMYSNGDITFRNVTFADNDAPSSTSALYHNGGTATLVSSIVTGPVNQCGGAGMIVSGGFNIDSTGMCPGLTAPSDRVVDPQLGPLADNGGPTLTHLPAASSPAIDGGNPVGCPATDQRGQMRPTDGNGDGSAVCDAGAVEFLDLCPSDPAKTLPGICGCGVPDTDAALPNGVADCLVNGELKARIARATTIVSTLTGDPSETALETELTDIVGGLGVYVTQFKAQLVLADPKANLDKLAKRTKKPVKKVTKAKAGKKLAKAKNRALAALGKLDQALAPQ